MKINIQDPKTNSRLVLWSYLALMACVPITVFCYRQFHTLWCFLPLAIGILIWAPLASRLDRIRFAVYAERRRQQEREHS